MLVRGNNHVKKQADANPYRVRLCEFARDGAGAIARRADGQWPPLHGCKAGGAVVTGGLWPMCDAQLVPWESCATTGWRHGGVRIRLEWCGTDPTLRGRPMAAPTRVQGRGAVVTGGYGRCATRS